MEILLTHGYFLSEDLKEQQIMKPYVPLGILYISAFLEAHGLEHDVFDSTFYSPQDLQQYIVKNKPNYIGIYVNLMTKVQVLKIITYVKNLPELIETKIILGGPEVRNHADNFLKHGADYIVLGEGEETFLELVQVLKAKNPLEIPSIQGICYTNFHGDTVYNSERNKIKNIDVLPFPNRKKVNLFKYLEVWKKHHGKNAISISTMRGCPYTCKWCSRAVYGLSYRRRSAELVVDEIISIQKEYAPDTLWFVDDVFTISHVWLQEFTDAIKRKNVIVQYECITRADRLNEDVFQLLKESGCFRVWIGAESGSQKIIDAMDRRVDVNQVRAMIQMAKNYQIEAGTFIMLGYPGETESDINETIHHLKISNPDHFTITVAYPIKGTELYQELSSDFIDPLPWNSSSDREIKFKRSYHEKYYVYAIKHVVNEVNYFKRAIPKYKLKSLVAKAGMWYYRNLKV